MFCPKCGSNQGEGKKFCTVCGTNLAAVSQALTGHFPQPNYYASPIVQTPHPMEIERQREMAKGVRLSIIGGGIVALNFFGFIFSGPFRGGSLLGFWTFIGFIFLAVGVSKIVASRPLVPANNHSASMPTPQPTPQPTYEMSSGPTIRSTGPHPVFSAPASSEPSAPQTGELEPVG